VSAAAERDPKGAGAIRRALCAEAISLERVLSRLMPDDGEVWGLPAQMLLHHARRDLLERAMMGRGSQ
jgi:predicted RNA polymerase sigma factor